LERHNAPIVLFVTLVVCPRKKVLANDEFHRAFIAACQSADAWRVTSYVIMPDHLHMFVIPRKMPRVPVTTWCSFLKRQITMTLGPHPEWDWLSGCWDTQMRSRENYEEKWSYVRMNPVRAGLVVAPEAWLWRGAGDPIVW
jgi:REP element-mobilizing transposase RayT